MVIGCHEFLVSVVFDMFKNENSLSETAGEMKYSGLCTLYPVLSTSGISNLGRMIGGFKGI